MKYLWLIWPALLLAAVVTGTAILIKGKGTRGEFTYLLLLGTKVDGEKPGKMLRDRIHAAYDYLLSHPDVICIVSGYQSGKGKISEAECMYRELTGRGIEPQRIWLEPKASSTKENLRFAMELIQEKSGYVKPQIGILSSEHHLLRAQMMAAQQGIRCAAVPAKTEDPVTFIVNFLREIPLIWYYSIFK